MKFINAVATKTPALVRVANSKRTSECVDLVDGWRQMQSLAVQLGTWPLRRIDGGLCVVGDDAVHYLCTGAAEGDGDFGQSEVDQFREIQRRGKNALAGLRFHEKGSSEAGLMLSSKTVGDTWSRSYFSTADSPESAGDIVRFFAALEGRRPVDNAVSLSIGFESIKLEAGGWRYPDLGKIVSNGPVTKGVLRELAENQEAYDAPLSIEVDPAGKETTRWHTSSDAALQAVMDAVLEEGGNLEEAGRDLEGRAGARSWFTVLPSVVERWERIFLTLGGLRGSYRDC